MKVSLSHTGKLRSALKGSVSKYIHVYASMHAAMHVYKLNDATAQFLQNHSIHRRAHKYSEIQWYTSDYRKAMITINEKY